MDVEFDQVKDALNQAKHKLPLRLAELVFLGPFVEEEDYREAYGETRFVATGPIASLDGRVFVVVYTWRNNTRRIISFRKANDRELRKYRTGVA